MNLVQLELFPLEPEEEETDPELLRRYLAGEAWSVLAEEFGMSAAQLQGIVRRLEIDLTAEPTHIQRALRARQTLQLEAVYQQAMSAWQASRLPHQTYKVTGGDEKNKQRAERIREDQAGDVRLLAAARGALEDMRKLWGLEAHAKTNTTANLKLVVRHEDYYQSKS